MARMTEEETQALDDFVTTNEITLGPNGSGWLSQRELRMLGITAMTVNYLLTKARTDNKSPASVLSETYNKKPIWQIFGNFIKLDSILIVFNIISCTFTLLKKN
jgi:hypothetical protein